jgi:cation:H+ antiporter
MFAEFLVGLFILLKGSDFFVDSASRIAKRLGVSEFVIGLTFVSIGTTLPELTTSIVASFTNNPGLVMGNLVGSNIANIGLILGLSAIITTVKIEKKVFYKNGLILLITSLLFFIFSWDRVFSRFEGMIMLILYIIYLAFLFKLFHKFREHMRIHEYLTYVVGLGKIIEIKTFTNILKKGLDVNTYERLIKMGVDMGSITFNTVKKGVQIETYYYLLGKIYEKFKAELLKDLAIAVISIVAVFFGADYVVESGSEIAVFLHIHQTIIGLIMVAIGTSLPELMVALTSIRKGLLNLSVGNIIGSCITNITLSIGVASLINPLSITELSVYRTIPTMILFTVVCLLLIKTNWKLTRNKGIILMAMYLIFLIWLIAR